MAGRSAPGPGRDRAPPGPPVVHPGAPVGNALHQRQRGRHGRPRASSRSRSGASSRSKAEAKPASPTTRSSRAIRGARSFVSLPRPTRRCASDCSIPVWRRWRATLAHSEQAGSRDSTKRSRRPMTSAPSVPTPTWGSSEAGSARPSRWRSRRSSGSTARGDCRRIRCSIESGLFSSMGLRGLQRQASGLSGGPVRDRRTVPGGLPSLPRTAWPTHLRRSNGRRSR